jgi:hypothetical protein
MIINRLWLGILVKAVKYRKQRPYILLYEVVPIYLYICTFHKGQVLKITQPNNNNINNWPSRISQQ